MAQVLHSTCSHHVSCHFSNDTVYILQQCFNVERAQVASVLFLCSSAEHSEGHPVCAPISVHVKP